MQLGVCGSANGCDHLTTYAALLGSARLGDTQVTERAMNGELDFNESLVARVKCLAGAPESVFDDVYEVASPSPLPLYVVARPSLVWSVRDTCVCLALEVG